jgi:hypothetical protein
VDLLAHVLACVVDRLPADDELAVALTYRELSCAPHANGMRAKLSFGAWRAAHDCSELNLQLAAQL